MLNAELKEELENKGEQFTIKNVLNLERNTKSLLLQYLERTGLNKRVWVLIYIYTYRLPAGVVRILFTYGIWIYSKEWQHSM